MLLCYGRHGSCFVYWCTLMRQKLTNKWGGYMIKKIAIYTAMMVLLGASVPMIVSAAPTGNSNALTVEKTKPQIRIQLGQRRHRRYNRNYRRNRLSWYRGHRVTRQYYWDHGVRRVRIIRY